MASPTAVIARIKEAIAAAQEYAKFIAVSIGGLVTIGSVFIPTDWAHYATIVAVILTAFSVWKFPNTKPAE